jgi:hypothetical protein
MTHPRFIAVLAIAFLLPVASDLRAVTLLDPFTDGQLVGGADNSGIAWYDRSANTIPEIINDAVLGNGNALRLRITNGTQIDRPVIGVFNPITLNIGDSLTLAFHFRFELVPSATFNNTVDGFRFGFYNSNTTPVNADGTTQSDNDFGYQARIGTGTTAGLGLNREVSNGVAGELGAGNDRTTLTPNVLSTFAVNDTAMHSASFSMTRTEAGLDFSVMIDGVVRGTGSHNSSPFTVFDEAIMSSGTPQNFYVDNVDVSVVPEPGSVAALSIGILPLLLLRRRA